MAPIQFGILMVPFQVSDVAGPLDVLSSCSKGYLAGLAATSPEICHLLDQAIDIEFHHIAETMEPITLTGNFRGYPTITLDKCPKLDYLLIGGPQPDYVQNLPLPMNKFIRARVPEVKTLFTTCTGGLVAAAAGVLDGTTATTNHSAIPMARQIFPQVNWSYDQWCIDGKFCTAGGAVAGMDMMADWVMKNYGMDVAEAGFAALDYEPRDINRKRVPLKRHEGEAKVGDGEFYQALTNTVVVR